MPPCNCHHPFPRPEPFSPLPRPGKVPDWGKWIRDRLAEKGALLVFPGTGAFPDPGAGPNLYLAEDTDIVYRWDGAHYQVVFDPELANDVLEYEDRGHFPETGHHGKLYIAADAGALYRWDDGDYVALLPGKADKAVPQAAGNFAALDAQGNLADSGKKPADFATAEQGGKADTAVQPGDITGFVNAAAYDAEYGDEKKPTILLKHGSTVVATVDATDFVIDGMVSNVEVAGGNLVITFNTDSGKQPISIPLTDIFDPANYYTKTAMDALLVGKKNNFAVGTGLVETAPMLYAYKGVAGTTTEGETRYTTGLADVGSTVYSWNGGAAVPTGETVRMVNTTIGRIYTVSFPSPVYYDRSAADDIPRVISIDETVVPKKSDVVPTSRTVNGKALGANVTLIARDIPMSGSPAETANVASKIAQIIQSISSLPGFGDLIGVASSIGYAITQSIYSNESTYEVGNYCTFVFSAPGNIGIRLFRCTTAITTPEDFNPAHWQEVWVFPEILSLLADKLDNTGNQTLDGSLTLFGIALTNGTIIYNGSTFSLPPWMGGTLALMTHIAPDFSAQSSYEVGQLVVQNFLLKRCTTAGTGSAAVFAIATVEDVLAALRTGKANASDLLTKLDSTSAAPAFSTSSTYAVGDHVTYNGGLYRCTTAVTTAGAWDASKWTADTMTDPDAVLDITAQNQLRVVAKDGTLLWAQGYDLASTSSATLACDAANNFTFANGATTQAFALPTAPSGKVGDFGLDIDNSANASAATISFSNIANNTASVVIPKGENLNDMLAIAAGELARFYISLTTFRVNNLPTWHIVKQVVENGGATV